NGPHLDRVAHKLFLCDASASHVRRSFHISVWTVPVAGVALSDSGRIAVRWSPATEQYGGQPCCLRAQRRVKRRSRYQFRPKAAAAAQCNHEYKEVTRGREHKVVVKTLPRASLIAGEVQVAFEASLVKLQPGLVAAQAQALNFAGPPVKVADKTAISLGMI